MSTAKVIKYAMTLDGAQYMQELRKNIAETKAAEQAIKAQKSEMGKITISQAELNSVTHTASATVSTFSGTMSSATSAVRGFNSIQSAYSQAMNGNFIPNFAFEQTGCVSTR